MSQNTFCSKCHRIPSQCCCTHLAYINKEDGLVCAKCFKPFTKELSDDEIADLIEAVNEETGRCNVRIFDHTKVLLKKLKEKYEREPKENN